MPARRDYTPEELQARLERERDLARQRMVRYRRRLGELRAQLERYANAVTVTRSQVTPRDANPPTPPVVKSLSLLIERVGEVLAPFAGRGYVHVERFWALAHQEYPELPLELEAYKIADWLEQPKNAKRRCTRAFLGNWLSKADQDRLQRGAAPPTFAQGRAVMTEAGPRRVPDAPGRPPDPEPVLPADVVLERIDPRVAQRALAAAKRLTLPEKLALATNGAHKA